MGEAGHLGGGGVGGWMVEVMVCQSKELLSTSIIAAGCMRRGGASDITRLDLGIFELKGHSGLWMCIIC